MRFGLDDNTLKDLDIFSVKKSSVSLYSIFSRTRTLGGRNKLIDMMEKPSADIEFLIERRDSIKWFYEQNISLDVTSNQLDLIEHYLNYNKRCLRDNFADAVFDRLYSKIQTSVSYYTIEVGIKNILKLLKFAEILSKKIRDEDSSRYLKMRCNAVDKLLDIPLIKVVLAEKTLSCFNTNKLDRLLRKQELTTVKEFINFIYESDVFESAAEVVKSKKWSFPEYNNAHAPEVNISGLFHPAINNAVENDLNINGKSTVFLTGPNTAGKSSLLKATGLAIYLAHIGFPINASKMNTSVFNGLITTINLPDDIHNAQSHYYSEVRRLKETALAILDKGRLFIIFDELFRGANPMDAYEASLHIINSLNKINNCVFIISTHIVELATELKALKNVAFKYLESSFHEGNPVFTFKLKEGVSYERLGMFILKNEGVIDALQRAAFKYEVTNVSD
jgi:DNA mismatch repair ATPase MutS